MSSGAILEIKNLSVFYGSIQVIRSISLAINRGEITTLIGSNGAGKTTLLDTISGLIRPAEGSIKFEGEDITSWSPYKIVSLGITQVPEGRQLFPDMTVMDNLIIGSYNRSAKPKKEVNLKTVFDLFPILDTRRGQLAKTLSGGEQQMLAIGRGLMSAPKLMLLDEMSLGLAPIVMDKIYRALKEISDRGITVFFVEQNVRRSLEEADKAYIVERGRVTLSGNVADLLEEDKVKKAYFGL